MLCFIICPAGKKWPSPQETTVMIQRANPGSIALSSVYLSLWLLTLQGQCCPALSLLYSSETLPTVYPVCEPPRLSVALSISSGLNLSFLSFREPCSISHCQTALGTCLCHLQLPEFLSVLKLKRVQHDVVGHLSLSMADSVAFFEVGRPH